MPQMSEVNAAGDFPTAPALPHYECVLLEKLSPTERAAYVLREAFDYSYDQSASILQLVQKLRTYEEFKCNLKLR